MDGKVTYWIEMSDYDLETADAMLLTGRYLYVGFNIKWLKCINEIQLFF